MRGFRLLFFWVLFGLREDNQGSEGVEGANPWYIKGMDETFFIFIFKEKSVLRLVGEDGRLLVLLRRTSCLPISLHLSL